MRRYPLKTIVFQTHRLVLEDEKDYNKGIDASLVPWIILDKHLKYTVKFHKAILNVAEDFESMFQTMVLLEFFGCVFTLCMTMYHASTVSKIKIKTNINLVLLTLK